MRNKTERRMLHIAEKPAANRSNLSRTSGVYYSTVKSKNYKVTRINSQNYYEELKTQKQVKKES
jgi:hypothetical protein